MSTPEQPAQGLTRKQLREIRMTGATPIVTVESVDAESVDAADVVAEVVEAPDIAVEAEIVAEREDDHAHSAEAPSVHFARPAEPVIVPEPRADAHVDLGVSPLTRRQAREQERIRTASVPVITPELIAAHTAETAEHDVAAASSSEEIEVVEDVAILEVVEEQGAAGTHAESVDLESHDAPESSEQPVEAELATDSGAIEASAQESEPEAPALAEGFGSHLLAGPKGAGVPLAPSFDELIARNGSTSGSAATTNALILQSPEGPSLAGPITATGEVLITGSLPLEGLGSKGHAPGGHDGKEVDAVLIDGELPAHSSPTPIAASAAISTVKSAGEIIRPPAPERGNRLMLVLAITAGALALALVGVLIVAFVTGAI